MREFFEIISEHPFTSLFLAYCVYVAMLWTKDMVRPCNCPEVENEMKQSEDSDI